MRKLIVVSILTLFLASCGATLMPSTPITHGEVQSIEMNETSGKTLILKDGRQFAVDADTYLFEDDPVKIYKVKDDYVAFYNY